MNENIDKIIKKKVDVDDSYCHHESESAKDKIWQQIQENKSKKRKLSPLLYMAAGILIVIGATFIYQNYSDQVVIISASNHGAYEYYIQNCESHYGLEECNMQEQRLVCSTSQITSESDIKNGIKQGNFVNYLSDGTIQEKGEFLNGTKHGEWFFYNSDGKLIHTKTFDNGIEETKSEQL